MPDLEEADLIHDAVLFSRTGLNESGQAVVSSTGVCIKCWWVKSQRRRLDPKNNEVASDLRVPVDREITIGSILWRGTVAGHTAALLTPPVQGYYQVVDDDTADHIDGKATRRECKLVRFDRPLPTT